MLPRASADPHPRIRAARAAAPWSLEENHREREVTDGILAWMRARKRPVLYSEIETAFGPAGFTAFSYLQRNGHIGTVYPEAIPGNSGRQFWVVL